MSPAQAAWHAVEREAGGTVLVVYGVADVLDGLQRLGAPLAARPPAMVCYDTGKEAPDGA